MTKALNVCDHLTRRVMVLLAVFTVTFFLYRDLGIRMMLGFGVLGLALAGNLCCRLIQDRPMGMGPLKLSFLVLTGTVLLNFLRPDSRHDADSISYILAMVVCAACLLLYSPTEGEGRRILKVLFGGGLFMTVFMVVFFLFPELFWATVAKVLAPTAVEYLNHYIPRGYGICLGGLTYTNYILYFGICTSCAWAVSRPFDRWTGLALGCAVLCLGAIVMVGRRGELLAALVCMVLLGLALCERKLRWKLIVIGSVVGAVLLVIIIVLLPFLRQFQVIIRYVMTFEQLLSGQDTSSGRTELFGYAWEAFRSAPVFGIGLDKFYTCIPENYQQLYGYNQVEDVHNIYLQFLAETGIVGTLFLVGPMLYHYYLSCMQLRRLRYSENSAAKTMAITAWMLQTFHLILGIYDPNFQKVIFWSIYALAIALQLTALRLEGHRPRDMVSRTLKRIIRLGTPAASKLWNRSVELLRPLRGEDPG